MGNASMNKSNTSGGHSSLPQWCDSDATSVSAERAQHLIKDAITPLTTIETVALRSALHRVAAVDVKSTRQVPNHTNSAMDGYALNAKDCGDSSKLPNDKKFHVLGAALAGKPFVGKVDSGQCVRIMTGAVMPDATDCVIIQEQVECHDDTISLSQSVAQGVDSGSNVRRAGEDLEIGEVAIVGGQRIAPSHLGLAASLGCSELPVVRKPRVAFFSNGDELRALGSRLAIGELYDSNRYTLYGMLCEVGVEMIDLGVVPDDADAVSAALQQAAACADVVITSAGASVGDADYLCEAVTAIGEMIFYKVAIKPGRPLAFGKIGQSIFFGLPGNPVSVMATFEIFVKPALRRLGGETECAPLRFMAQTTTPLKKRRGRVEYQRGILTTNANQVLVQSTGEQGSGILSSMGEANCFIILPTECEYIADGETVEVQPFVRH